MADIDTHTLQMLAGRLAAWGQNSPDPDFFVGDALSAVLGDCADAADGLTAALDENERLRKALAECAAGWRSPPTTIGGAFPYLSVEFQRRMHLAADALAHP